MQRPVAGLTGAAASHVVQTVELLPSRDRLLDRPLSQRRVARIASQHDGGIAQFLTYGSGVLVRLHYADSLVSRSYRVVPPGDTSAPGAVVAVRYLLREAAHGFSFDSGTVQVGRKGDKIGGRIQGSGIENAIRTPSRIDYHDLSLNRAYAGPYVDRLLAAEALVLVFPVWNYGYPAILKGFFDRVFLPGVSFILADGGVKPNLNNIRKADERFGFSSARRQRQSPGLS